MRLVARFAFAGVAAALLAGCADSRRFVGDPLGNPFKTASTDPAPTGSLEPRAGADDMAPPPYQPRTAVVARPLAPPSQAPRRVATYEAPRVEHTAAIVAPSGHGTWSGAGGMSVTAADGETAAILAARYNVPTDALLKVNGFASASAVRPGTRLVIPVYSAGTRVAVEAEPARPAHERVVREVEERRPAKVVGRRVVEQREVVERHVARTAPQRDTPKHEGDGETMHWKRGPQPARMGEVEPRAKHAAAIDKHAEVEDKHAARKAEIEDKRAALKAERQDRHAAQDAKRAAHDAELEQKKATRKAQIDEAKASRKVAKAEVQEDKPARVAKVETTDAPAKAPREAEAPRKAQSDPTPTASLPPADEKVAAAAGPEFRWPAHGRIIQGFKTGGNDGINIAVPEGTSVKAAESGVVAYAGSEIKGFGNLVLIRHPNGFVSAYANNGDIEVKRGEQVKRGQVIAKSGQSGNVASPQLHFELRRGSTPVDPTRYLAGL